MPQFMNRQRRLNMIKNGIIVAKVGVAPIVEREYFDIKNQPPYSWLMRVKYVVNYVQ